MSHLTIAIDETGSFQRRTLTGFTKSGSGMAAVLTTCSERALKDKLRVMASWHEIHYPADFHAIPLARGQRRPSAEQGTAIRNALLAEMEPLILARVGIHGMRSELRYFHEQQAWGEMLMALLWRIQDTMQSHLQAADTVRLIIARRGHRELTGFVDPDVYHRALRDHVEQRGLAGWPQRTRVEMAVATRDPFLMLADFQVWRVTQTPRPDWTIDWAELSYPADGAILPEEFRRDDYAGALLLRLIRGETPGQKALNRLSPQGRHNALRRLVTVAHAQVSDRFAHGEPALAMRLLDFVWAATPTGPGGGSILRGGSTLRGEVCTVAAEVLSHEGRPATDGAVQQWRERAEGLSRGGWAVSTMEARAKRLAYRCQTVQLDSFNVFAFDDVYLEFLGYQEGYEAEVGGALSAASGALSGSNASEHLSDPDQLYGKILGTIGQAAAFLRAQDPDVGSEAMTWLERSAPHFAGAEPLYRAMSLGYRLTDLWDRGALDEAWELARSEGLPRSRSADAFALLHRLRLTAAAPDGLNPGELNALLNRALVLPSANGADHPRELVLKWALYLGRRADAPQVPALERLAVQWLSALDAEQAALDATSLPLRLMLGDVEGAKAAEARLLRWPGFEAHWRTDRAKPLIACLKSAAPPDYAALRGMPWNYA